MAKKDKTKVQSTLPEGYTKADVALTSSMQYMKDGTIWSLDGKTQLNKDGQPIQPGEPTVPPTMPTNSPPPVTQADVQRETGTQPVDTDKTPTETQRLPEGFGGDQPPSASVDSEGRALAKVVDETATTKRLAELEQQNAEQAARIAELEARDGRRKPYEGQPKHVQRQMAGKFPANVSDIPTVDEINKQGQ